MPPLSTMSVVPPVAVPRSCIALAVLYILAWTASAQENRKVISKPDPAYPQIAKQMNLSGTVKIQITISPAGNVQHTDVIGGHPILVNAALDALKKWKYEPAKTESTTIIQFDFKPSTSP